MANDASIQFTGSGGVITSGTSSSPGEMYLRGSNSSMTIAQGTTLTFGDYGKFYVADSDTHEVTLDGTLEFTSLNSSFYKVNISSGSGTIDMGKVREYSDDATSIGGMSNKIHDISISPSSTSLTVYLPFNCKFSNVDLSNAKDVYYTVLKEATGVGVINKIIQKCGDTYGDYACDLNLGVSLPKIDGEIDRSKLHVTEETQGNVNMSLSEVTNDTTDYNILGAGYYLKTDDLDDTIHNISGDTIYYFGFIGTTPIQISGNGTAIFMGDNSKYGKEEDDTWSEDISTEVSLPAEVEFGANNSLFPFSYTYGHGTFTADNLINTIPAGAEVKFTSGFTLGVGHTLVVKGTLIG